VTNAEKVLGVAGHGLRAEERVSVEGVQVPDVPLNGLVGVDGAGPGQASTLPGTVRRAGGGAAGRRRRRSPTAGRSRRRAPAQSAAHPPPSRVEPFCVTGRRIIGEGL
jgi:hypothetical protein